MPDVVVATIYDDSVQVMPNTTVMPFSNDCNDTGTPDECDIATRTALDCNVTGVPDSCETIAGFDFNDDGDVDLSDYASFEACLSGPGRPRPCLDSIALTRAWPHLTPTVIPM